MNDDLISRDEVLKQISCWIGSGEYRYAMPERFLIDRIITLSSVTPQEPKTGYWVKTPKAVMGEGYMWYCDKCEHQVYQDSSRPYPSENYCPNCGARMAESEEAKT